MGALRLGLAALAPLHVRDLLQAPVVLLNLPARLGKLQPPQFIHLQLVGGPVLRLTVLGNYFARPSPSYSPERRPKNR